MCYLGGVEKGTKTSQSAGGRYSNAPVGLTKHSAPAPTKWLIANNHHFKCIFHPAEDPVLHRNNHPSSFFTHRKTILTPCSYICTQKHLYVYSLQQYQFPTLLNVLFLSLPTEGWAGWGRWSVCSQECDGGVQVRSRACQPEDDVCEGTVEEGRACNPQPCIGKPTCHYVGSTWLQVALIQCNNHIIL